MNNSLVQKMSQMFIKSDADAFLSKLSQNKETQFTETEEEETDSPEEA